MSSFHVKYIRVLKSEVDIVCFDQLLSTLFLRQGISLNLKPDIQPLEILPSLFPQFWENRRVLRHPTSLHGWEGSDSGPQPCAMRSLPTEPTLCQLPLENSVRQPGLRKTNVAWCLSHADSSFLLLNVCVCDRLLLMGH